MSIGAVVTEQFPPASRIAQRFVAARMNALALDDFPGPLPPDLSSGYEVQDAAIRLWRDEIAGWKIGRIAPEHESKLGETRLAGPIFRHQVRKASPDGVTEFDVFVGGFAAVEAEFIFEIGQDAPAGKLQWSVDDAAAIVGRMLVGIETAGSPLATINLLGPTVIVSDFGNNAGLIIGPEVPRWRERQLSELTCQTAIEGHSVGRGSAENILGGPLESLRFVAEHCAKHGRPLKTGMLISTGAATGVHDIVSGQRARVEFDGIGVIQCKARPKATHT